MKQKEKSIHEYEIYRLLTIDNNNKTTDIRLAKTLF